MEKTKQRGNVPVSKKTKKKSKTKSRSRNNIGVKLIEKPEYYDYNLVAAIILLTCFGLVMLYSTSAYTSTIKYGDDMYFFKKQAAISFVCIAGALFISMFDYHILARFTGVLYGVAAGSMVLVRTPLGTVSNGARRWLRIGPIQFQPAEIAKIAVIVCLSYMIVHMGKKMNSLKACMTLGAMGTFLALLAYVCTDNLSTAIIIFCITVGMIFVAHPKTRIFLILAAVAIAFLAILVFVIGQSVKETDDFRLNRIIAWLHPENATGTAAYQTIQALYAIGSGGFLGRGLGNSIQKLGSVPEAQNDMIFSIICEELGIVGGVILLLLFGYLLYRLCFIAQNAPDLFGSLIVSGIFIHIALQVILNIAVVVNLMPNTGVTLPFISYGGTSIMFLMAEMGLALSVSRQIKLKTPERVA
ncbi:FtsW/RodA/SpoVE family cell cycle protein [Blautia sp.]|uniref:FtsW/RodA/SpoVE family cell cycle protein n=1 Tax=Blautia sp. TaxID=1955243 RepID=UPI0025BA2E41|nr:putative peptidoglycan glycosyltransferase FtsW [Blautia sp.]